MQDRRRDVRVPITLKLEISKMFKQDNVEIPELHAEIDVTDISKSGIGFLSPTTIPIDFYFDATINFGEDKTICTVIKVIRACIHDEKNIEYGCEFVGISPVFVDIILEYENAVLND